MFFEIVWFWNLKLTHWAQIFNILPFFPAVERPSCRMATRCATTTVVTWTPWPPAHGLAWCARPVATSTITSTVWTKASPALVCHQVDMSEMWNRDSETTLASGRCLVSFDDPVRLSFSLRGVCCDRSVRSVCSGVHHQLIRPAGQQPLYQQHHWEELPNPLTRYISESLFKPSSIVLTYIRFCLNLSSTLCVFVVAGVAHRLHSKHGKNVVLLGDGCQAVRVGGYAHGIVFSAKELKADELFAVHVGLRKRCLDSFSITWPLKPLKGSSSIKMAWFTFPSFSCYSFSLPPDPSASALCRWGLMKWMSSGAVRCTSVWPRWHPPSCRPARCRVSPPPSPSSAPRSPGCSAAPKSVATAYCSARTTAARWTGWR